ncbi:hypothetical protein KEM55_003392 [Ascosphaera atra]|nr:hypothetical protein KEM55_003392 [Ascosphaera atra]
MTHLVERRVFHCIVDDTALAVNITLERLRAIKLSKPNSQLASNAGQALNFLDRATSGKYEIPETQVVLQGPLEQFERWEDAQGYFLEEFKEQVDPREQENGKKHEEEEKQKQEEATQLNEMSQMLLSKLNIQKAADPSNAGAAGSTDATSPSASETSENSQINSTETAAADNDPVLVAPAAPDPLKPLLSCVLWQLHESPQSKQAAQKITITPMNTWVLVTNDWALRNWAVKYGIQVKNIHQLRTAIAYEDKEFKNHVRYMERNQAQAAQQSLQTPFQARPQGVLTNGTTAVNGNKEDESTSSEDELVFIPRGQQTQAKTASPRNLSHAHQKSNSRTSSSNVPNANAPVATPQEPFVDGTIKPSPVVEIPSSPIDPDSFSRNIVVTNMPHVLPHGHPPSSAQQKPPKAPERNSSGGARGGRGCQPVTPSGKRGRRGTTGRGTGGTPRGRGRLWVP